MPASAERERGLAVSPVALPFTVAPAWGAPFEPSVTRTVTGAPVVADPGPDSLSAPVLLKASKTQSTSSPWLTRC